MRFEKWEGLGNDFIVTEREVSPAEARWLCDRHRGVGADGVLVVGERGGAPSMTIFNADGSRPEMCGNGLRCVAGWLAERGRGERVVVRTDAGDKACAIMGAGAGRYEVTVDMGAAQVTGELVFAERSFALVDVGNPHAVCFDEVSPDERERLAPALSRHVAGGVNVELCTPRADEIVVVVFERGVGWTDACGTGACAVVAAGVARGLCQDGRETAVRLPGGVLFVRVSAGEVFMRGPAGRVFVGDVVLPPEATQR